jgi:hypothetical protein
MWMTVADPVPLGVEDPTAIAGSDLRAVLDDSSYGLGLVEPQVEALGWLFVASLDLIVQLGYELLGCGSS